MLLLDPFVNNIMLTNSDVIVTLHLAHTVKCVHHNGCDYK